ncbi:flagellar basal body-associated FliL family protein [Methylopila turkensis]|uniref:Flagellar protein FliL n=1 Tax=Methylopila turkensis TaxID=1437816 RepID=A0A9W6N6G1_9HYPH|nr:flagellar basal body-associated FliL family protein [Methylopila turkensis]GLK79423.1 hypothetical protein GCM10008174_11640 [Methylopila turkensis]
MAEETGADGAAAKPKSRKKLVIIGAAAAAVLIGGGAGAYLVLGKKKGEAHAEAGGHGGGGVSAHGVTAPSLAINAPASFVELPEMTVNLAGSDADRQQYVRMTVALEVASPDLVNAIKPLMPRVIDSFQTHLREMRPADLRGSSGVYRLKEELLRRVNVAIAPAKADAVLFKDIVVQ